MKINSFQNGINNLNTVDLSSLNASKIAEQKVDVKEEVSKVTKENLDKLSLTGSELTKDTGKLYNKEAVKAAALAPLAPKPRALEDFSLDANAPVKAGNISKIKETNEINQASNKIVISDEQMDDFLHKAFNLFDLDY